MKLREDNSKLSQKNKSFQSKNISQNEKILLLEKKSSEDCDLMLSHLKEH